MNLNDMEFTFEFGMHIEFAWCAHNNVPWELMNCNRFPGPSRDFILAYCGI
jgi:hypothetical protein